MSVANYDVANTEFLMRYYEKYGQIPASVSASDDSIFSSEQLANNTCTDGSDDGKIGLFSKIGNALEGVWNMGKNLVTTAIKHPFKTAAMIGLCCIPVVGPAIGAGMAAYGLYQGGKQIVTAYQASENATTDAEAKAAWENIGSGVGTTALSAVGLKGSVGVLKGQLTGGSTTVQALKGMKGASKGELVKTAVSEGIKETAHNAGQVAQAGIEKATKAYNKGKQYWQAGKNGNLAQTLSDDVATVADKAGTWAGKKATKAEDFYKKHFTKEGRAAAKAQASATTKAQIADGTRIEVNTKAHTCSNNSNVKWNAKKGMYELTEGNTVTYYDKNGLINSKVTTTPNGLGGKTTQVTTVSYKNGQPSTTSVTQDFLDGSKTTTLTNAKGKTSTTTVNKDGVITHKQLKTGETYDRFVEIDEFGNKTVKHKINPKGEILENVNKVIDYQLPGLGENTNELLMFMSVLDEIDE